jgi:hypothetical protein
MNAVDDFGQCCGDSEVLVTRVLLFNPAQKQNIDHIRGIKAFSQEATDYKALSKRFGNTRRTQRNDVTNGMQFKANAARQIGSTVLSTILPGDTGPLRSPVRSAFYRTVTPGFGGGRRGGSLPGQNRAARCPEGYQFGGRFTDNRLSTCGAKLFDIPSVLGLAIGAARRALTSGISPQTRGRDITGAPYDSSIILSRAPQIPKVTSGNPRLAAGRVTDEINAIGKFNKESGIKARRMVRRDGFVLEPVVPNKVLRAIPDNRDMEGASFLMSALSPRDIGGEELGLLSNTGVKSLIYVLPGGSSITLEKARPLEIGERRKLGRVVNQVVSIDNSRDPSKRLRFVADEIGTGLKYSENFKGVKNPNEIIKGRISWASQVWGGRLASQPESSSIRNTETFGPRRKLIKSVDEAVQFLVDGGSMSAIDPSIMPKVLAKSGVIQKQRMANNITAIATPSENLFLYEKPKTFQHIGERFASDVQQALGLESPDVIFAGKPGDTRQFLRQEVTSAIPGSNFNPDAKFNELEPRDVAAMLVSDFLTDQRERPMTSIYTLDTPDARRLVLGQNSTSGLIDLSKIEITKRMKLSLEEFYSSQLTPSYSDYYQALKAEQRIIFMKYLSEMINRARKFNPNNFKDSLNQYGLSEGEKIHLNILGKLFESRLEVLKIQKNTLRKIVTGASQ